MLVAACAHAPDLPLRPDPAPPPGSTTEVFVAADGTQLLARSWAPAGPPRAAVVIVHGLKDYSARYAGLASRLAGEGFAVFAFDLRGHGRSAGPRVAPRDWNDYVGDLDRFLALVERRVPGKPVFLFGHSMGGAIATRAAELHRPEVAGLALSGAALAIDAPPLLIAATRLAGFLAPGAPALALDDHDFSSDPANAAALARDPLVSDPPAPARTAAGLVAGIAAIWRDVARLDMPLLAMHGTADRLTAPWGSRALIATAPARDKTLRIYDRYFHDLLHEPGGKGRRVEDDLVAWLDAHAAGHAGPPAEPYTGRLAGEPRGWTQAVAIVGGTYVERDSAGRASVHPSGRLAIELARPSPLGFHGELVVTWLGPVQIAALRPVGVALHAGPLVLGASAGVALGRDPAEPKLQALWTAGSWLELDNPVVHLGAFAELDESLAIAGASLRLPGDRAYWPRAVAGVGPVISGGLVTNTGGTQTGYFLTAGLALYGAD